MKNWVKTDMGSEISKEEKRILSLKCSDEEKCLLAREYLDGYYDQKLCKEPFSKLVARLHEIDHFENYYRSVALPACVGAIVGIVLSSDAWSSFAVYVDNVFFRSICLLVAIFIIATLLVITFVLVYKAFCSESIPEQLFVKDYEKFLIRNLLEKKLSEQIRDHNSSKDVCVSKEVQIEQKVSIPKNAGKEYLQSSEMT